MPHERMIALVGALLLTALTSGPGSAFDQTTAWYSINIQPATPASPPRFLTNGSSGVTLEGYRSGDPTQMWAITQEDYPAAARVSGPSGGGVLGCLAEAGWGCPFLGNGGMTLRFINRASGGCLTFATIGGRSTAATAPCAGSGTPAGERQKWRVYENPNAIYTSMVGLSGADPRCLTAPVSQGAVATGGNAAPSSCDVNQYGWFQLYRAQESGRITCTTLWAWDLCFVEGQRP